MDWTTTVASTDMLAYPMVDYATSPLECAQSTSTQNGGGSYNAATSATTAAIPVDYYGDAFTVLVLNESTGLRTPHFRWGSRTITAGDPNGSTAAELNGVAEVSFESFNGLYVDGYISSFT